MKSAAAVCLSVCLLLAPDLARAYGPFPEFNVPVDDHPEVQTAFQNAANIFSEITEVANGIVWAELFTDYSLSLVNLFNDQTDNNYINGAAAALDVFPDHVIFPNDAATIDQLNSDDPSALGTIGAQASQLLSAYDTPIPTSGAVSSSQSSAQADLAQRGNHAAITAAISDWTFNASVTRNQALSAFENALDGPDASQVVTTPKGLMALRTYATTESAQIKNDDLKLQAVVARRATQEAWDEQSSTQAMLSHQTSDR